MIRQLDFADGFESSSAPDTVATPATDISVTPVGNLVATNAQTAFQELDSDLTAHISDSTDAHAASAITNTPSGNLAATTVQAALNELQTDVDTRATSSALSDHISDATDAHAGSAITNTPSGNLAATTVQGALNELQTDVDTRATSTALNDHINDSSDAHAASAITNTPSGSLSATTVQAALNELQSDIDGITAIEAQDQSYELSNLTLTATVGSNALTVALKTQSGTDPSGGDPVRIGLRNETLTTGTYTMIPVGGALSVTVSSGSTLGHSSGNAHYIYVYAMRVAGSIELALSSSIFDEGTIHSSTAEGGAGAADSNALLYSTTARSNISLRLIGRLKSTQATAGTWASAISEISLIPFKLPTIAAIYTSNTAQSFDSGTDEVIVYEDKEYDPYNAVVTNGSSTWVFTAPASRLYSVKLSVGMASTTSWDLGDRLRIRIRKNGSDIADFTVYPGGDINNELRCSGTRDVYLSAGDTIDAEMEQVLGGALALNGNTRDNWISITEIGF